MRTEVQRVQEKAKNRTLEINQETQKEELLMELGSYHSHSKS